MVQAAQAARGAARQTVGSNNLRMIGLAMMNFHDAWGRYPNSAPQSEDGKKWLSWRVHVLPYLDQQALYEKFALNEAWDSPAEPPSGRPDARCLQVLDRAT